MKNYLFDKWAPPALKRIMDLFIAFSITMLRNCGGIFNISARILFFNTFKVRGLFAYTNDFKYSQRKKSGTVKSGELAGQAKSPKREIRRDRKVSYKIRIVSRANWQVATSCRNSSLLFTVNLPHHRLNTKLQDFLKEWYFLPYLLNFVSYFWRSSLVFDAS